MVDALKMIADTEDKETFACRILVVCNNFYDITCRIIAANIPAFPTTVPLLVNVLSFFRHNNDLRSEICVLTEDLTAHKLCMPAKITL